MAIDRAKVESILSAFGVIAGQFIPGANVVEDVALLRSLIGAGTALNDLLHEIQTNPDTAAVWTQVKADYAESVAAFEASVAAHTGA